MEAGEATGITKGCVECSWWVRMGISVRCLAGYMEVQGGRMLQRSF